VRKALSFLLGDDPRRLFGVKLFKPYCIDYLKESVGSYFSSLGVSLYNQEILKFFNLVKARGYKVVIATATLDFIGDFFSEALGVTVLSSEYSDGAYVSDIRKKKISIIKDRFPGYSLNMFVSDNLEDINDEFSIYVVVVYGKMYCRADSDGLLIQL